MMKKSPLVSVVVITYNSENTIIDTLESIKAQTYNNIELIISDDCSKDKTVSLCKEWITNNKNRFISTEIITVEHNTGTAGNLNRGNNKAKGIWIKGIAGDDKLIETCIESNINYVINYPETQILLSKVVLIGDKEKIDKNSHLFNYKALKLKPKELLYLLLTKNFLPASTLFIRKNILIELDGYDESIPLLEDWPFWIKALYNKKKISFNDNYTVYYRMSENSISLRSTPNPLYIKSINIFKEEILKKYQKNTNILLWYYYENIKRSNTSNYFIKIISKMLNFINPITYYLSYINLKTKF